MEYRPRSRGLAVEFAVLGQLIETPIHGYELRDRIAEALGSFWRIASSQLYQVLHRLEEQGWIEALVEPGSTGPSRTVYRATKSGRAAFWEWVVSPVDHVRRIRVELLAKLFFLDRLAPERLGDLLDRQIAALRARAMLLDDRGRAGDDRGFAPLVASYRRSQVDCTIRWLEEATRSLLARKEKR